MHINNQDKTVFPLEKLLVTWSREDYSPLCMELSYLGVDPHYF